MGHPSKFQRVTRLGFVTAPMSLKSQRRSTKLCKMFGRLLRWYNLYIQFWGLLPTTTEFCHVQHSHCGKSCVLLYWQRYCTTLEQYASAKLCGMLQGRELGSLGPRVYAPPRIAHGSVAIMLNIGPHSIYCSGGFLSYGRPME